MNFDPSGETPVFIENPYGCVTAIDRPHIAKSAPGHVKVNGGIIACSKKPDFGVVSVALFKTAEFGDVLEDSTTCNSTQKKINCNWIEKQNSTYQMWNQNTKEACKDVKGVTTNFYGVIMYAMVSEGGVQYENYGGNQSETVPIKDCWTPTPFGE